MFVLITCQQQFREFIFSNLFIVLTIHTFKSLFKKETLKRLMQLKSLPKGEH
jgi:hypothetical protein